MNNWNIHCNMKLFKNFNILKFIFIVLIYASLMIGFWLILKHFKLNDIETLRAICTNNFLGYFLFVALQVIQVVFLPINGIVFTIPAIIIFGSVKGFFVSYVGLILGSIAMFFVGRFGGIKLLNLLIGKEKAKKCTKMLGKGKFLFPIFMIVGLLPDDLLIASAGVSNIKFSYFIIVVLITRAIDLAFTCFVGIYALKSTVGIVILSIFFITIAITSLILTRNQDKLENWFVSTLAKKNKGS